MALSKQLTPHARNYALVVLLVLLTTLVIVTSLLLNSQRKITPQQTVGKVSPMPTLTPALTDADMAGWKKYVNKEVGYSIDIPAEWKASINKDASSLNHQDWVPNLGFNANPNALGNDDPNVAFMDIPFPINIHGPHKDSGKRYENGLRGLEKPLDWTDAEFNSHAYTWIDGHTALIVKSRSATNPPAKFQGSWCSGCSIKDVYIEMNDGKILTIEGYWGPRAIYFESLFDKVVTNILFNK